MFRIRRSVLLRNQADTEQMLTWSSVFVLEKKGTYFLSKQCSPPDGPNYLQLVCVSILDVQQIKYSPFDKIFFSLNMVFKIIYSLFSLYIIFIYAVSLIILFCF